MPGRGPKRLSFVRFCTEVLHLRLTTAWRALLTVSIDGVEPGALDGEERAAARELFGDVEEIDPRARRVLVWRLGRSSGKTTVAAALAIWAAWTSSLEGVGPGQVPCAFSVSPTKSVAKIMVGVARNLVGGSDLARFVVDDAAEGFTLRRPDGRVVELRSVAASRGGANLRGRDVIVLVLDESEFFASGEEGEYAVTDRDQVAAAMPRLIEFALCISTPWPTENLTAELFDRNHGHPADALAALGPSMFMRPTPRLVADIERERARDPENAEREYDCVAGPRGSSRLFDKESLEAAVDNERPLVITAPARALIGCGGDLALERDSSAIAVAARDRADVYALLEFDEVRPKKGAPLSPRFVIRERFAPIMVRHRVRRITADAHYRQSAIEHLNAVGLRFVDAPAGAQGKYDSHMFFRAQLRAGKAKLPNAPRLIAQLRSIVGTPMPGGLIRISSPRRAGAGGGHGDIASAVILSFWAARRGDLADDADHPEPLSPISYYESPAASFAGWMTGSRGGF